MLNSIKPSSSIAIIQGQAPIINKGHIKETEKIKDKSEESFSMEKFSHFLKWKSRKSLMNVSNILNVASALARFTPKASPFKSMVNKLSWLSSQAYGLNYAFAGITEGIMKKNVFFVGGYLIEGLAALFSNVSAFYLARGMATALDVIPASLEHLTDGKSFDSYTECLKESTKAYSTMLGQFKSFAIKLLNNPLKTIAEEESHVLSYSSLVTFFSSLTGVVTKSLGAAYLRDLSGFFSDLGLVFQKGDDKKTLRTSGLFYLAGSILDAAGWTIEKLLPIQSKSQAKFFENIGLGVKELAKVSDRIGGNLLVDFNQREEAQLGNKLAEANA